MWGWRPYVPAAKRRANAQKQVEKMKKKGKAIEPVTIEGRAIARAFWGKKWCEHLESFADYANRLPRGRTYVRNGSVCHLAVRPGHVEALVSGSSLYTVEIRVKALVEKQWEAIKGRCVGHIGSLLDFLQGKISEHVMEVVADQRDGLIPNPSEIEHSCSCPDWAGMCKHVAAVLYGIGNRLDVQPELLFHLRGVDPAELISTELKLDVDMPVDQIGEHELADIFGIDLDTSSEIRAIPTEAPPQKQRNSSKTSRSSGQPKKIRRAPARPSLNLERCTGQDIANLRKQHGLSVTAFASRLLISPAAVYRWEKSSGLLRLTAISRDALQDFIGGRL